jgi:hypothetical protein
MVNAPFGHTDTWRYRVVGDEYNEQQGTRGGQDAGNSDDVTENSPAEPGKQESPATGGTDTQARGVTGSGGHGTDEREGIGRAPAITDPEVGENRPG